MLTNEATLKEMVVCHSWHYLLANRLEQAEIVIPAKAGILCYNPAKMPACAGMMVIQS